MPINLPNGANVEEIVLPNGSQAERVIGPDGSTLWERVAIPDLRVDDFERNNIDPYNEYEKNGDGFSVVSEPTLEGDYCLEFSDDTDGIRSTNGLDNYPEHGSEIRFLIRFGDEAPSGGLDARGRFEFAVSDENSDADHYEVGFDYRDGELTLAKTIDPEYELLDEDDSVSYPTNSTLECKVVWDDEKVVEVYDGRIEDEDPILASLSATDTELDDNSGIGWQHGSTSSMDGNQKVWVDDVRTS